MGLHLGPDDHDDHGLRHHVHLSSERILAAADYAHPDYCTEDDEVCNNPSFPFPMASVGIHPYTGPGSLMIDLSTRRVLACILPCSDSLASLYLS